jgi:hypothetical protein
MSVWLKRMVVLSGIVAVTVVGLTALDKRDERTCLQDPALALLNREDASILISAPGDMPPSDIEPDDVRAISVVEICDGFLPW